ncbi:MAG: AraC-like DNA-binding protein [Pseudohongiellaceae bacterium]|jgi:AraC-like DNA-binding protein
MRSPTIAIYFVQKCLQNLPAQPELQHKLLEKNHISPSLLYKPNTRVPGENYANLSRDTMQVMGDEIMGFGTQAQKLGCWATMTELATSAPNLGEALKRLTRFYRLIPWGLSTKLEINGELASISLTPSTVNSQLDPYLYESFLFYIHRTANWLIGRQIPLHRVDFSFSELPQAAEYWNLFLTNNIHYQQPRAQIQFSASMLEQNIHISPQALNKFLTHVNFAMITQSYTSKSWYYKVGSSLEAKLEAKPSFADIANDLNLHPHTLRNYLREEGFQYQDIKDRVRCDSAIFHLSHTGCSVEETASLIGFSEASAFIRSFKKWTGAKPMEYKKQR